MDDYMLWLSSNFYNNPALGSYLVEVCGSPEGVFKEDENRLVTIFPNHEKKIRTACATRRTWDFDQMRGRLERLDIRFISKDDIEYPAKLLNIAVPPLGLFVRGDLPAEGRTCAAMVGARECSPYGANIARWFSGGLAAHGVPVISGMARGIDGISHRGALAAGGLTYAVMGCGADICYPESNRDIYMEMEERGGIISEYPPGVRPLAAMFPQRNRIISALSDVVLIIEARAKSGSLITADFALEQGRDVYAVPGALLEPLSEGCNNLIKQGAGILISPEILLEELGFLHEINQNPENQEKFALERPENPVYSCLSLRAVSLDHICRQTGLSAGEAVKALSALIIEGRVREVGKNSYSLAK